MMRAIVQAKYGKSDVLELKEVAIPTPKINEVLIKVKAVSINDYDWSLMRGKPYIYRLMYGLMKPKSLTPGMEISGEIVQCGEFSQKFDIGDAVFGDISDYGFGGFAEYLCVNENALTKKPSVMSFEDAASIPHAATLALQGLVDIGNIQTGEKVLINGAGGGVGMFGVNIAKLYNSEVTGVDAKSKFDMMKSAGFDYVVDYKVDDFTKLDQCYDLILDTKTNRSVFHYLKALSPKGRYVTVGGSVAHLILLLIAIPFVSMLTNKRVAIVALKTNKNIETINELYISGKLVPILERNQGLDTVPESLDKFGKGEHKGKIVIAV